jgi:ATP-dependent helicase/nuclease subunit B
VLTPIIPRVGSDLLAVLAELCRKAPLGEKIVVVPSLALGHQIGDALARAGTAWVNLRFETTRTLADAIAGFSIAREGQSVLSRAQALAILERACDRVLVDDSYFAELRGRPGLYRAIQRSIDDLRHAGVRELPVAAFEDARKARDLARILETYEAELLERRYVDRYGVLAKALEIAASGAKLPWDASTQWVVLEDLELSHAEHRLVDAIAGTSAVRVAKTKTPSLRSVHFARAVGAENEIRNVLRRAAPYDDAEIVYTARDPYLALAYELTAEHRIPATFAEGISAAYTRPGQAVLGFLRWVEGDFAAVHLQQIARAGVLKASKTLSPFAFARVLRKALIGWGAERYVPRIQALLASLEAARTQTDSETRIAAIERDMSRARESLPLIEKLLSLASPIADAEVDPAQLARVARLFLDGWAVVSNEMDAMALAALRRMFGELMELPESRSTRTMAIARLGEAVRDVHVSASNPRPGHLHVTPLRNGGWSGRQALFVVGLDDAQHPGSGMQDPIVLDAERAALNASIAPRALDLLGDAPQRATERLQALFARGATARWTLSWPQLDLQERRGGFPSRDVLAVFRAMHGAEATFESLINAATPAGFLEADAPLSLAEWGLAERFLRGARLERPAQERAAARASDALTEYDGRIAVERDAIDPRRTNRVYSASQLEKMARCPFGWFVERVLRVEPVEELERVQDEWLNAMQFGTLVHEVLEETMGEIAASKRAVSVAGDLPRMLEIARSRLAHWRAEVPPGTETAFTRQERELLETCEIFLRTEERVGGTLEPMMFEAEFGADGDFAIELGQGRSVKLRGSIDRVDRDRKTGNWEVWDYKTGSLYGFREKWELLRGTKLQHVIYTRALEHLLREQGLSGKVQCAGYYFPTPKGAGAREARTCAPGKLEEALNALFDVVGSGFFPQPDEGRCAFCPYETICGDKNEAAARMIRKQDANAEDEAVKAWRKVQAIE